MSRYQNSLIVKSNDLINARYDLSISEQRIFLYTLTQIEKDDHDFKHYEIQVSKIIESVQENSNASAEKKFKPTSKSTYEELKEATGKLISRHLHIPTDTGFIKVGFVSSIEYIARKGVIVVSFDPRLKPHLIELKNRFTTYDMRNVLKLESKYSIRLYELLKQFEIIGKRTFKVDELRSLLNIKPKEYERYSAFKLRVLEKPKKELAKHCDLKFTYEEKKTGRKVTEITFIITPQKPKYAPQSATNDINEAVSLHDALKEMGLTKGQIESTLNAPDITPEYIWSLIEYVKPKKNIKSTGAYLFKLIVERAEPKSKHEKHQETQTKEQEAQLKQKRQEIEERKLKREKEKQWIEKLQEEFYPVREMQKQEMERKMSEQDWKDFEEYARQSIFAKDLFQNGILNKQSERFDLIFGAFSDSKLLPYQKTFIDWAYYEHGVILNMANDGEFYVAAQQGNLFNTG